jgi:endonuclease-3
VPRTLEELEALPGVGRKTASVVLCQAFRIPAFPVDTHIHRLAERWGLSSGRSVEKTERDLKAAFPESSWIRLHLQMILFGREHCPALRHDPAGCPICSWAATGRAAPKPGAKAAKRAPVKPAAAKRAPVKPAAAKRAPVKPAAAKRAAQRSRAVRAPSVKRAARRS